MRYDAVLFDFDGTIADTERGISAALRTACEQLGMEPIPAATDPAVYRPTGA